MSLPFPFTTPSKYLRTAWNKQTHRFLSYFFRNVAFCSDVEVQDGVPLINYCRNWRLPGTISTRRIYASYFKLYDATDGGGCKIGVTDGGWVDTGEPTYCGVVKVNGESLNLAVFSEVMSAVGTYWVWLHSWIDDLYAKHAEIIVGDEGSSAKPDNPNDGIAYASELLGRFTVVASGETVAIGQIIQDYLKGGEHTELLVGSCSGGAVVEA